MLKVLGHQITKQETAPENLFDQWDDHHQPQKAKRDRGPIKPRLASKDSRIETLQARRKSEKSLRRNPKNKNKNGNRDGETGALQSMPLIFAAKPKHQTTAQNRLQRIDPVFSRA